MIVFDLRCGQGHVFEAWFRSSGDFENQRGRSLVACPVCGSTVTEKSVMAPNVGTKGNRNSHQQRPGGGEISADIAKDVLARITEAQAAMLATSQWVGPSFADRARAMHLGEEPAAQIHGQATADDARALIDEGVPVAPLLVPIIPPDMCN